MASQIFYHYTSARNLRPISRHGLTVGDVPTDLDKWKGMVGVWLTTSETAAGHGLAGSALDKSNYRLSVRFPDDIRPVRWLDWAARNVTSRTMERLHEVAAMDGAAQPETWFVFFGIVRPEWIIGCTDTRAGVEVEDWPNVCMPELDMPAIPAKDRAKWHKNLMRNLKAIKRAEAA